MKHAPLSDLSGFRMQLTQAVHALPVQASTSSVESQRRRLAAALERLERGSYGICCSCREPMDAVRLREDPAGPFCADCEEELLSRRR